FFQAEDGIRDRNVTGVQTCALPISLLGERDSDLEIFRQSLRARDRLVRLADREGAECRVVYLPSRPPETALEHLEANFFGGSARSEERRVGKTRRTRRAVLS